jgi:thiamine biosynthesis lipoprotein
MQQKLQIESLSTGDLKKGLFKVGFNAMGCPCEIQFCSHDPDQAKQFKEAALHWVKNFENTYTRFKEDSLISQINQAAGKAWVEIDAETEALFDLCDQFHFITQGLFDPTSLPVIKIWDYKAKPPRIPNQEEIVAAKALVGWNKVEREPGKIRLSVPGMGLDLGGIGKEYAVDRVSLIAKDFGIADVLINFGGDIAALGKPPEYSHWHIGIEDPGNPGTCWGSIALTDLCVASSGDYRRFFEIDGKRYGHMVDHRKGYPIANKVKHTSIVSRTCTEAGILATAACLLGEDDGMELINTFFGAEGCIHTEFKRLDSYAIHQYMVSGL